MMTSMKMVRTMVCGAALLLMAACGMGDPIEVPAGFTGTRNSTGRFGGSTQASSFSAGCNGLVSANPDHQLQVAAPLAYSRFVVNGGTADTTLVVQTPDGQYHCNDDAEGRNPIVEIPNLQAGLIKVWVGAYATGQTGNYRFALSTLPSTSAASLGAPTQSSSSTRRRSRRRRRRR